MATAVQIPAEIDLEEYLHTTYRPDCEYIDGKIVERNVGKWSHARLMAILAGWLGQHEREWSCLGALSARIFVTPTRVRVPDLILIPVSHPPQVLIDPPLLVVEIIDVEDTYSSLQRRVSDYRVMGVEDIWIIDPETRSARIVVGDSWTAATRLEVHNSPIFVDLPTLFAHLDETA